jgi:tetratricopeptide (TPR) repeat protein
MEVSNLDVRRAKLIQKSLVVSALLITEAFSNLYAAELEKDFSDEAWGSLMSKGRRAQKLHDMDKAELLFSQALAETQKPGADEDCALESIKNLVPILRKKGKFPDALRLSERGLSLTSKKYGENSQRLDPLLHEEAEIYLTQRNYASSAQALEKLVKLRERVMAPEDPALFEVMIYLCKSYSLINRFAEQETLSKKALLAAEKQHNLGNQSLALSQVTWALAGLKKWKEAEPYYKRQLALAISQHPADDYSVIFSLLQFGACKHHLGENSEAERLVRKALYLMQGKKGHVESEEWQFLTPLGTYLTAQGKYAEAEKFLLRSLAIAEKTPGKGSAESERSREYLRDLYHKWGKRDKLQKLI